MSESENVLHRYTKNTLSNLVLKFKEWLARNYSPEDIENGFYDDAGYPGWQETESLYSHLLESGGLRQLDRQGKENLLYLIARNWDIGSMINWLSKEKQLSSLGNLELVDFIELAAILTELKTSEYDDAKVQFVSSFGKLDKLTPEIEGLLLKFYDDENVDIKGRALIVLGRFGYSETEELLEKLWQIDDEFNKIKCLSVIDESLKNRELMIKYLHEIEYDDREHLNGYANRLKRRYKTGEKNDI